MRFQEHRQRVRYRQADQIRRKILCAAVKCRGFVHLLRETLPPNDQLAQEIDDLFDSAPRDGTDEALLHRKNGTWQF